MAEISLDDRLNMDDVPAMPHIAAEIVALVNDPDSNASQIAKAISKDQAMSARLMQVANSPFYGRSKGVNSIQDAVVLIGYPAVKGIVLTTSTRHLIKEPSLMDVLLWDHAVATGFAAHHIAQATRIMPPDDAFTAGLLHDIARVVMSTMDRERYVLVMKEAYNHNYGPEEALKTEERLFTYTHAEMGWVVAQKWRLSENLRVALQYHHITEENWPDIREEAPAPKVALLICLANLFQYRVGVGTRQPQEIDIVEHVSARELHLSPEKVADLLIQSKETFEEQRPHFAF